MHVNWAGISNGYLERPMYISCIRPITYKIICRQTFIHSYVFCRCVKTKSSYFWKSPAFNEILRFWPQLFQTININILTNVSVQPTNSLLHRTIHIHPAQGTGLHACKMTSKHGSTATTGLEPNSRQSNFYQVYSQRFYYLLSITFPKHNF